ncbi:MAG: S8 family peptidase [Aestuariibacter sp.]
MKLTKIFTAIATAGLALSSVNAAQYEFVSAAPKLGDVINDNSAMNVRVIVHAEQGKLNSVKSTLAAHGATFHVEGSDWVAVTVAVSEQNYTELLSLNSVRHVEIDQKRHSSPLHVEKLTEAQLRERELSAEAPLYRWVGNEAVPYGIDAVQAYDFAPNAGAMPKVCIVDTGYNLGHPDLPASSVDGTDDGAGPWYIDGHGHGSHVAGTIAAPGDDFGVVGVIEDSADLYIVRVFNDAGGFVYASDLAGAVQDCADAGAKVVSMSLGGILSTEAEEETLEDIADDGVLIVAAAGNDGNASHSYPASYDFVYSVAATDAYNNRAPFSQRTAQVQFAAPGVSVVSTVPGGYALMSGTSMATPHVSGVMALVWSHFPQCDSIDMLEAFQMSAKDLDAPGYDYNTGWGLIQARAAYDLITREGC